MLEIGAKTGKTLNAWTKYFSDAAAIQAVARARFMTGVGYRLLASANLGELVLGCIEAKFASKHSLELGSI